MTPADTAGTAATAGGDATAGAAAKRKKCRKGYVRKRVRGKVRCVKKKVPPKPKPPPPPPPPPTPPTITTDVAVVRQHFLGTLWYWTKFTQAGSGGTTDRAHVNLCADGTLRLRRSSTTEDGSGESFTIIIEDLAPTWTVVSGSYDSANGNLEATINSTSTQRRERTARGSEYSQPNALFTYKLARRGSDAFLDDQPAFKLTDPPFCSFES